MVTCFFLNCNLYNLFLNKLFFVDLIFELKFNSRKHKKNHYTPLSIKPIHTLKLYLIILIKILFLNFFKDLNNPIAHAILKKRIQMHLEITKFH